MQSVRSRTIILSMCVCVSFSALMRLLSYFHLHLFNVTHLTFLCYLTMVMLYIYDVTRRLIHKQVKTVLIVSGLMLFLWLCLRTIKYQLDPRYPTVIRYLWYAYYFCDLGIVTAIFSSILLVYRKASKDHLLIFGGLSLLGSLFVFTNDAHRLVFAFPNGLTHYETYTYAIGYYGIMAYIALLLVISLIVIVKEERMHAHKILYPLAFFLLGVFYCVSYVFNFKSNIFLILFKPTEMACLIFIGLMEALLMTHLFPANDHYQTLIHLSSLQIGIFDEKGNAYVKSAIPITFKEVQQALKAPLSLEHHLCLHAMSIRSGYAYFIEDVSTIEKQKEELMSLKESLDMKNALLKEDNRIALAHEKVKQQTMIYERIQDLTKSQRMKIEHLFTLEDFDTSIKQVAILGAYIKRFSDLYLQASTQEFMSSTTLSLCLRESLNVMKTYGMITDLSMTTEKMISSQSLIACYEAFEEIVEAALPHQASLLIYISYEDHLIMDVEVSKSARVASIAHESEEGVLYYHWEG